MKTRETEGENPKVEGQSKEGEPQDTNKRIDELEAMLLRLTGKIDQFINRETHPKLNTYVKPEDRLKAMKQAKLGDEQATSLSRSIDLRHPGAETSGFQSGDIFQLKPESEKYRAYCLDTDGKPVKQIMEYQCQKCPRTQPYTRGKHKVLCECGGTMHTTPTGEWEEGQPAYGVVLNFLYKTKKNGNKYKVNFPDFGKPPQGCDALTESEMVLCQRS